MVWEPDKGVIRRAGFSDYCDAVYMLISLVGPGYVTTYGSIARVLGVSPRLVGRALASNNAPIIIPCHRVVKSDGSLGGYSAGGYRVKRRLLMIEGVSFDDGRVRRKHLVDLCSIVGCCPRCSS